MDIRMRTFTVVGGQGLCHVLGGCGLEEEEEEEEGGKQTNR